MKTDMPVPEPTPASAFPADPGERLQLLIGQLDELPGTAARELAYESLHSILELYGQGFARILQLVGNAGNEGEPIRHALLQDRFVRSLLLVHGLHPSSLEERLREALQKVRPYLKSHGGDIELVSIDDDSAKLRFSGACQTCPSSSATMELAIRSAIEDACPDLTAFELEQALGLNGVSHESGHTRWHEVPFGRELEAGQVKGILIGNVPAVVCRLDESLYAYRNRCPTCGLALEVAGLVDGELRCRQGHRYDARNAGRSLDNATEHLDPFPLLVESGSVKVAVNEIMR